MKDRHSRRRPFAAWIKRVANLKGSSNSAPQASKAKNKSPAKNNPYPESGHLHRPAPAASANGHLSFSEPVSRRQSYGSDASDDDLDQGGQPVKSAAPTLATNPETIYSDAGQSKAETSNTRGGALSSHDGGANSTFSSPNHSERSLTTTLTTIQSTAPSALLNGASATAAPQNTLHPQSVHFSHQYPVSPASAVPAHLQPNPHTYQAATAGNTLSDNASIMTLASSSKRRRRNSLDTNASVRALAPSSVWGGSRESLPLSVLSGNVDATSTAGGIYQSQNRPGLGGVASAERASVYSSSGAAPPALNSERNSYYATGKQGGVETGSVRSGLHGHHGRAESLAGSVNTGVGGPPVSPLASPVHPASSGPGRMGSRRSSNRREDDDIEDIEEHEEYQKYDNYDHDEGDANTSLNGDSVKAPANGFSVKEQDVATNGN
ncbi:hypothetical protein UCDDS831_g08178 [Diplodia seriata]|uniref:Ca2+-modulated nonselective cation channel polycystin n=1 Tax=Diplodia seriata TaxID=420778 RepID=A0A0G2FRG6_9PEZI|nr:hypothetical protein UCDDS831_g08178 [Diplodia seriata]